MGIREKILIALMASFIGYGAYDFVMTRIRKGSLNSKVEEIKKQTEELVATTQTQLSTSSLSEREQELITRLETPWTNALFTATLYPPVVEPEPAAEELLHSDGGTGVPEAVQPAYRYSGILNIGGEKMAFINGRGYKVGEEVGINGYRVKSIESDQAILQRENGNQTLTLELYQPVTINMIKK